MERRLVRVALDQIGQSRRFMVNYRSRSTNVTRAAMFSITRLNENPYCATDNVNAAASAISRTVHVHCKPYWPPRPLRLSLLWYNFNDDFQDWGWDPRIISMMLARLLLPSVRINESELRTAAWHLSCVNARGKLAA